MSGTTCCFIGHREIYETEALKLNIKSIIEQLIISDNIDTFLFGSKSCFNDLCYDVVTELQSKYPHIKRIYVRAEFFQISKEYQSYLLSKYEETYYPENILHAGVAIYIERNIEMINKSDVCVFYFEKENLKSRKSGTFLALQYAKRKKKFIINTFE